MTAVYGGSFNPFTIGHEDIVRRALAIADEVHIIFGKNIAKPETFGSIDARVSELARHYADEPRVKVLSYEGILAKYALSLPGKAVLLRGIRTGSDLALEAPQADTNRLKYGVETLFLMGDPALSYISSSLVRELQAFGEDVSEYLPR